MAFLQILLSICPAGRAGMFTAPRRLSMTLSGKEDSACAPGKENSVCAPGARLLLSAHRGSCVDFPQPWYKRAFKWLCVDFLRWGFHSRLAEKLW